MFYSSLNLEVKIKNGNVWMATEFQITKNSNIWIIVEFRSKGEEFKYLNRSQRVI